MDMEQNKSSKRLFAFNSFTGVIQLILGAILIIVCIPVFINHLGSESYGVFSAVSIIGSLAAYANLSLDASLIKFLAEQGKCKESDYDIATMFVLLMILLIPTSSLLFYFKKSILIYLFDVPAEYIKDASILVSYLIIANFLLITGKIFSSVLESRHKIYLTNFAMFVYSTLYWGGIIITVLLGYGLKEIGISILFAALVWFLIVLIMAFRNWGMIKISGLKYHFKPLAKKQLKYSSKIYTSSLFAFLYEPLTKILISNLWGVTFVGIYDIALRIKTQVFSVFLKIMQPLLPTIANIKEMSLIKNIIDKFVTSLFYISIPIIILLVFCAEPVINIWIGGESVRLTSIFTIVITSTCILFSITVVPIYAFLRGKNHPDKEIYVQIVNVVTNLLIIALFYKILGFYSILLGNTLSLLFSCILCLYYIKKYLGIIPFSKIREQLKYIICIFGCLCPAVLLSILIKEKDILYIITQIIVVSIVTIITFFFLKIIKKEYFILK